jgi:hypothetical protein
MGSRKCSQTQAPFQVSRNIACNKILLKWLLIKRNGFLLFLSGTSILMKYFLLMIYFRGLPMYKKGQATEKQLVHGGDVAAGIVECILNHKTAGKTYQFVG